MEKGSAPRFHQRPHDFRHRTGLRQYEANPDNYSEETRFGQGHIKPPSTPGNPSPIAKGSQLKIYQSQNFYDAYDRGVTGTYRALGSVVTTNALRNEQTGSAASAAMSTMDRFRDVKAVTHAFSRTGGSSMRRAAARQIGLIDLELRKTEGTKRVSKYSIDKSLWQAEKVQRKGGTLTQKDKVAIERMKTRQKFQKQHDKVTKAKFGRQQLRRSMGDAMRRKMSEGEDAGAQSLMLTNRAFQNRYIRKTLTVAKRSAFAAVSPLYKAGKYTAKVLDRKYNEGKLTKYAEERKVKRNVRDIKKLTKKETKKAVRITRWDARFERVFGKKFKDTGIGRAVFRTKKGFAAAKKRFDRVSFFALGVKRLFRKAAVYCGGFLLAGCIITTIINSAAIMVSNFMVGVGVADDGRFDLSGFSDTLNQKQSALNTRVSNYKKLDMWGGVDVKKVYVNYLGTGGSNNFAEILSMAAVRFGNDFEDEVAVEAYIGQLWEATNFDHVIQSEIYFCDGCIKRDYYCYEDLPAGTRKDPEASDARKALYASHDHSGEAHVSPDAAEGCTPSAPYYCTEKGHATYYKYSCSAVHHGQPGKFYDEPWPGCSNYKIFSEYAGEPGEYILTYLCLGHCDGKHIDYSCPGHTEKVCAGHVDLTVNVTCVGFDEIFEYDSYRNQEVDLGNYKQGEYLGVFEITYYCTEKYPHICNGGPPYKTATGTTPTPGRTIAVDPDVIPLGSKVIINGHVYTAEDTGGAVKRKHIDVAVGTHAEALRLGVQDFKVYKAVKASSVGSAARPPKADSDAFEGWTDINREQAKLIAENITPTYYKGIDDWVSGGGTSFSGVSLEGLEITGCKIPVKYYSQHDARWANTPILPAYPQHTISAAGCGFSSMAIVVSSLTSKVYDPPAICAMYPSYYAPGQGAYHSLISKASSDFGLSCKELRNTDLQGVMNALKNGKLVVALVGKGGYGYTGSGYYRGNGHFLVICGVSSKGELYLADPNRPDMINKDGSPKPVGLDYFIDSGVKKFWVVGK